IIGFAEVAIDPVELPLVLVEVIRSGIFPWQPSVTHARDPSVAVDGAAAEHFEILDPTAFLGLRVVEAVDHADTFDLLLRNPVDLRRLLDSGRLQNRRRDVDDVVELGADAALVLDPVGPGDDERIARAAEVRGDLLAPLERRVHGPLPSA